MNKPEKVWVEAERTPKGHVVLTLADMNERRRLMKEFGVHNAFVGSVSQIGAFPEHMLEKLAKGYPIRFKMNTRAYESFLDSSSGAERLGGLQGLEGMREKASDAIREHFLAEMPKNVRRAMSEALTDLYEGPARGGKYSFSQAVRILSDWWGDAGTAVWYDYSADQILTKEPEGYYEDCDEDEPDCEDGRRWVEPVTEDIYHFDTTDIKRILFGQLAQHI